MATPVITAVTPTKTQLVPGESIKVTVDALDADSRSVTVDVTVRDSGGALATHSLTLFVNDNLTFGATASAGTIVRLPEDPPNVFTYTAP